MTLHPNHGKTFANLSDTEALAVVDLWTRRYQALGEQPNCAPSPPLPT